jgi:protein arginine kinase|tara:strand:- start:2040 stop:3086 length:1047 start_codon:yes stop_codon:yes gene_type:complete
MKIDPDYNCPFNSDHTPFGDVVLSSRARLARNLEGFPFVNRSTTSDCIEVASLLSRICTENKSDIQLEWIEMDNLDAITTEMFVERHLISSYLANSSHPCAIAVGPELSRSVMVNEEDHIRIQSIRPGLQLDDVRDDVHQLDLLIEEVIAYAFDDQLGFLTACPTNLGTGARFSVMVHLPGLRLVKDLERVHRACEGMSLAIRGYRGEGSGTMADLYQVSNQITLGNTEEQLCNILAKDFLPPVIEWERKARMTVAKDQSQKLDDQTFRSLGLLQNARILTPEEAMNNLGNIRLGINLERIDNIDISTINQLLIEIHPGHLRWKYGHEIEGTELNKRRADLVREKLEQ